LKEFGRKYGPMAGEEGPVKMVREVFGATPDPWQEQMVLRPYGRGERRISVRSAPNVGKTTAAAWCICHQLLTRYPQKTGCTAPTTSQLFDALFTEVKVWLRKLPPALSELFDLKAERIELRIAPEDSFLTLRTARSEQPEAFQGLHREDGWVLVVFDEASGIPEVIYDANLSIMAGQNVQLLLFSNPIRTSGYFFDSQTKHAGQWVTGHVSAFDCPRVSQTFVDEIREEYGEDSNAYRVRVLAEFPRGDWDAIIPFELLEAAKKREAFPNPAAPMVWGLDVAEFGDDLTALCKRKGNIVPEPVRIWQGLETMQVVGVVKAAWDLTPLNDRPQEILVDAIGMGSGVASRLHELGLPARAIKVSELPALTGETYTDLRTELCFLAKDWFTQRDCTIPQDEKFIAELAAIKIDPPTSGGKIRAWNKRKTKKIIRRSPDRADSFFLTFAATAATALLGGQHTAWGKPLPPRTKVLV
jgi:phage terminase large subunit